MTRRSVSYLLAFLLILALSIHSTAQQKLMFRKSHSKVAYYEKGEVISFRLKGDGTRHTFQIEDFTDTTLVFRYHQIALTEISHIYVDQKTRQWFAMRYKYEKLLLIAGFGYFMLDVINTGELSDETKWVSLSLIGAGIVARFMVSDKFRLGGRKRLYILDL